jgi:prevent-host-death family protein
MTIYTGHMATKRSIGASEFKAKCLALLDEVASTGETLIVTKRGKPVARVVPAEEPRSLVGTVTYHISDEEFVNFSLDWGEGDTELIGEGDAP